MLETIREYAVERLAVQGELESMRAAHADHLLALAERAEREFTGADQAAWLATVADEHENLRAALEHFLASEDHPKALRLGSALVIFWFVRGFYREGLEWLERAVAGAHEETAILARALWAAGFFRVLVGDPDEEQLARALALARRIGDGATTARVLSVLGLLAFFRNDSVRARTLFEESADTARRAGDTWCLADALGTLSSIYPLQGRVAEAKPVGEEALVLARRHRDQQGIRMALFGLALAAIRSDAFDEARRVAGEGLAISRDIGDPWFTSYFLWLLATAAAEQRADAQARAEIDEALTLAREIDVALLVVCALDVRARLDLVAGDLAEAEGALREALEIASVDDVPQSYVASAHHTLARVLAAAGQRQRAVSHLEQAIDLSRAAGDTWLEARAASTAL
jgi:tetratricopeptide (TPR) repeat protein